MPHAHLGMNAEGFEEKAQSSKGKTPKIMVQVRGANPKGDDVDDECISP